MNLIAVVIDDTIVNWIGGAIITSLSVVVPTIVLLWRKFIAWIKPQVEEMFTSHTGLVNKMEQEVPIVSATLKQLGETQSKQCETLEQHGKILDSQQVALTQILQYHQERK